MSGKVGDGPSVILVGVDGTASSMRAGAWAAGMARRQGSSLVVLFVETTPAQVAMAATALVVVEDGTAVFKQQLREQIESGAHATGLDIDFVTVKGDPFTELTRIADERRVDAVVVGASTKAGHRLIGSLAVRVVRAARWPVTVVP